MVSFAVQKEAFLCGLHVRSGFDGRAGRVLAAATLVAGVLELKGLEP